MTVWRREIWMGDRCISVHETADDETPAERARQLEQQVIDRAERAVIDQRRRELAQFSMPSKQQASIWRQARQDRQTQRIDGLRRQLGGGAINNSKPRMAQCLKA